MIIDCFPFFNELDVLEVRLHELAPYVDHFVLAECSQTHTGNPKPLFFEENKERFKEFKITHIVIPPMEGNAWEREAFGRKYLLENIKADHEDILLISDVDEIPNLKEWNGEEGVFGNELFLYYFNCFSTHSWKGTFAVKKKSVGDFCINPSLRVMYKRKAKVVGTGWHFSSIGSAEDNKYKIESCACQEINTDSYKRKIENLRNDKKLIINGGTCPEWLSKNKGKYPHLFKMEYDTAKNKIPGWMSDTDLLWLFATAKEMESIVEIGSWKGRSTHALLSGCKGTVYAVDHFLGSKEEPGPHAEAKTGDVHKEFLKNVGGFPNLKVLKMDNASAVRQFEDNFVDMVFIYGGHTYEEVLSDIIAWLPKAKKIICGHDRACPDVVKAVSGKFGDEWERNEGRKSDIWIKKLPILMSVKNEEIPNINKKNIIDDFFREKFNAQAGQDGATILHVTRDGVVKLFRRFGYKEGVEIGTAQGWFAQKICQRVPLVKLFCVDPWIIYDEYPERKKQKRLDEQYENAKERLAPYNCELVKSFSRDAVKNFEDDSLDFVFIDANHSFEYVIEDIALWSKKVRSGGMISGHDFWNSAEGYGSAKLDINLFTKNLTPIEKIKVCQVKDAVSAWVNANKISPWYLTGADDCSSWFWIK